MSIWKKVHRNTECRAWPGEMPVYYLYTPGASGEKFFSAIKEKGKFLAGRCPKCGHVYLPPRIYCEKCMEEVHEFFDVEAEGRIVTWTIVWRDASGNPLSSPVVLAFINISGTNGGVIHRIISAPLGENLTGRKVKAKFKEKVDRIGSLNDIEGFELAD